ncbi:hypothetical protein FRC08_004410 [Ceratobasidium sp. 394]|nr:hypothetical protein FRC08_004410 [Ceratobasidium sp. 394]
MQALTLTRTDDDAADVDSNPSAIQTSPRPTGSSLLSPAPPYLSLATPAKCDRVIKACACCHACKRKCTGIGGPNCGTTTPVRQLLRTVSFPARAPDPVHARIHPAVRAARPICASCVPIVAAESLAALTTATARTMPRHPRHLRSLVATCTTTIACRTRSTRMHLAGSFTAGAPVRSPAPPGRSSPAAPARPSPAAPDICHSIPGRPSYKECRVGEVPCTRLETRADDSGSPANSAHAASVLPAASGAKGATPAPAPASCEGRACIAYRKLKMRSVALNSENGNANLDGPDERQWRCERAGLERIYVDRKRQGPGAVFGAQVDGTPIGPGGATGSFGGFTGQIQN